MKKKILLGIGFILIAAGILGYFLYKDNQVQGAAIQKTFSELIGTRTGSTTAGVGWYGAYAATTTYPFALLGSSQASIVIAAEAASTSAAGIYFEILGSNDFGCNTATTTTIYNILTTTEVEWFDATPHIMNASAVSSFSNTTTTVAWADPYRSLQREISLVDLDMQCLALRINASSTVIYAQYRLKD